MPECGVGADVMTGFPGETDAEFEDSRAFIEALPFTYLHVFTYSARPGTPAANAPQVPMEVRKHRTKILRDLSEAKGRAFRESLLGRPLSAVTIEDGLTALSHNYVKLSLALRREPNQIIEVVPGSHTSAGLAERGCLPIL